MSNPFDELTQRLIRIESLLSEFKTSQTKIEKPTNTGAAFSKIPIQEIFKQKLLSKPTFYKHVKEGSIQLYKLGGRSYVDLADFEKVFHKVDIRQLQPIQAA